MSGPTRPTSEQLRLVSSKTGEHVLDTYLEAAEKGNRTLPDLLDDLFNASGSFYRGSGFYNWKGDYTNGTPYITGDTFKSASTGSIYVALKNFTASNNLAQEVTDAKISLVFDGANIVAAQTYATNAQNSATAAATSASNAQSSASTSTAQAASAATSAAAASGSATAAATSATDAATSRTNAANSASAASTSATAASSSQTAAATSATNAQTSATAAAASQSAAATSATASQTSATNAAGSASTAAGHASTASTQATNAANSATTASTQATAAAASASTATTQASTATTQATNAASSATSASASASTATTQAATATSQAATATTQATNAATSATNAANSATNAQISETNAAASAASAATSETNAASSATAAASARDATLAAFDSFDDRYLGSKTADPALDNDGNALVAGALYFNSTTGVMKLYTGSAWVAAYVAGTDFVLKAGDTMTGQLNLNANLAVDTNTLFADATNHRIGIGTATPATKAELSGSAQVACTFAATTTGTTLDVTSVTSGALAVGQYLSHAFQRVRIIALGTGTGGVGTYIIDSDQTSVSFSASYADLDKVTLRVGNSNTSMYRGAPFGALEFGGAITNVGARGFIQASGGNHATNTSAAPSLNFGITPNTSGSSPARTAMQLLSTSANLAGSLFLGASQLSPRNANVSSQLYFGGRSQTQYTSGTTLGALNFSTAYINGGVDAYFSYGYMGFFVDPAITAGTMPVVFTLGTGHPTGNYFVERLRINKDGNIGIGTTNPSRKLDVNGDAAVQGVMSVFGAAFNVGYAADFVVDAVSHMVGINTALPTQALEVKGSGLFRDSTSFGGLKLQADNLGNAYIDNLSNGQFYISNNGAVRLHITDIGSVGIGTTGLPNAKLHVAQDGVSSVPVPASTAVMRIESGPTGPSETILQVAAGVGSASIYLGVGSLAGSTRIVSSGASGGLLIQENSGGPMAFSVGGERMRIDAAGNVGIGTTAPTLNATGTFTHINASGTNAAAVHLTNGTTGATAADGMILARWNDNTNYLWVYENEPLAFGTNSTERMRIDAAGNVGIGTSAPIAPLHVSTSGVGTAVLIESTDDTNVSAPSLVLRRSSPSPAANDYVGQIFFQGMDTAGAATNYARILARIEDPTNTSEDGALYFHTTQAGASTTAAIMNSVGDFTATGNVTAYSDARLKTNVRTVPDALALVQQMRGVFFDKDGSPSVGVIAQEMEAVLPEVVHQGEYKSVAYGNIVGVLIEAIKEQQKQIDDLKQRLGL